MFRVSGKPDQPHHAAAELVELRRVEGVRVVHVAEVVQFGVGRLKAGRIPPVTA